MTKFNHRKFNAIISQFDTESREQAFSKANNMLTEHNMRWVDIIQLNVTQAVSLEDDGFDDDFEASRNSGQSSKSSESTHKVSDGISEKINSFVKFGHNVSSRIFGESSKKNTSTNYHENTKHHRKDTTNGNIKIATVLNHSMKSITHRSSVVIATLEINGKITENVHFFDLDDIIMFMKMAPNQKINVKLKISNSVGDVSSGKIM